MKKTQEILGLPIISISDGNEVGRVKSIIVNAEKGAIDYVVVDSGIQILSARVIPTENILGIGEYALTIEDEGVISDISKIPAAVDLLRRDVQVKGTKVLTKKGRLIGEIGDIYVDEDASCKIKALEFIADITQKKIRLIPSDSVITFGKNLIVVQEDVESFLVDKPTELGAGSNASEFEKKNPMNPSSEYSLFTAPKDDAGTVSTSDEVEKADEYIATEVYGADFPPAAASASQEVPGSASQDDAANLFEQRQRQYLLGRRVTKTIMDNYGSILIDEGEVITENVILNCKDRGKLIELVMNNKA